MLSTLCGRSLIRAPAGQFRTGRSDPRSGSAAARSDARPAAAGSTPAGSTLPGPPLPGPPSPVRIRCLSRGRRPTRRHRRRPRRSAAAS